MTDRIHHKRSGTIDTTVNQPRMSDPAYVGDLYAALAALTQNATYPSDIEHAIGLIEHAISRARLTDRPGDEAAVVAEETGMSYSDALVFCNMD